MTYPFAKDFTCWFYPLVDDETPEDLLTAQTPAIYLFTDMPGLAAAAVGTGAVAAIAAWTWSAGRNGFSFTVPAVPDPDPSSGVRVRTYWLAVNFKLQTGGVTQTVLRSIELERVSGVNQSVTVTDADLQAAFPQLDGCSNEPQRVAYVALGIEEVKARLKAQGFRWHLVHNLDRLKLTVVYKVLSMITLIQIQQGNDKWLIKYKEFKDTYTTMLDALELEYDSDGDGKPETKIAAKSDTLWVIR